MKVSWIILTLVGLLSSINAAPLPVNEDEKPAKNRSPAVLWAGFRAPKPPTQVSPAPPVLDINQNNQAQAKSRSDAQASTSGGGNGQQQGKKKKKKGEKINLDDSLGNDADGKPIHEGNIRGYSMENPIISKTTGKVLVDRHPAVVIGNSPGNPRNVDILVITHGDVKKLGWNLGHVGKPEDYGIECTVGSRIHMMPLSIDPSILWAFDTQLFSRNMDLGKLKDDSDRCRNGYSITHSSYQANIAATTPAMKQLVGALSKPKAGSRKTSPASGKKSSAKLRSVASRKSPARGSKLAAGGSLKLFKAPGSLKAKQKAVSGKGLSLPRKPRGQRNRRRQLPTW